MVSSHFPECLQAYVYILIQLHGVSHRPQGLHRQRASAWSPVVMSAWLPKTTKPKGITKASARGTRPHSTLILSLSVLFCQMGLTRKRTPLSQDCKCKPMPMVRGAADSRVEMGEGNLVEPSARPFKRHQTI